ncbi:MAG: MBL fold metallo-hydrolase [Tannerellaceae bacterium]|jgi:glyoxylase-like metal-dependent hydrolase (beta-lactamase superfamily II)|nr:MBL fold metallo-hydrolase [Tannerellaceae bacterium]
MITVKSFSFNYFSVNTYIVHDNTGEAVIIDCGCINQQEEEIVRNYIAQNNLTLKHNLCTHLHLDHILGNAFIHKTYKLSPEAHKSEASILPSVKEQARMFGLTLRIASVPIKRFITGGGIIAFGNSELAILSVPGHSPGGLAFYNKENGYLFSGDTLFAGSIGRTDLWGGSTEVLTAAITDKLLTLPDDTIVYPGHGPETTIYAEKIHNPYL